MTIAQNYAQTWIALKQLWKKLTILFIVLYVAQTLTSAIFFPTLDNQLQSLPTLDQAQTTMGTLVSTSPFIAIASITLIIALIDLFMLLPLALFVVVVKNRNTQSSISHDLSQFGKLLIPLIKTWLMVTPIALIGYIAFIIPGIILTILFSLFPFVVIYRNTSGWDAVKGSMHVVKKHYVTLITHVIALKVPAVILFWLIWTTIQVIAPQFTLTTVKLYASIAFVIGTVYIALLYEELDIKK